MAVYIINVLTTTIDTTHHFSIAFISISDASRYLGEFINAISEFNNWHVTWNNDDMSSDAPSPDIFSVDNLTSSIGGSVWGPYSRLLGFAPFEIYIYEISLIVY